MSKTFEAAIDLGAKQVPMIRLVDVEMRKLVDTRAGLWLMILIGSVIVLVESAFVITAIVYGENPPWSYLLTSMATPLGLMLAVLGIMTVTSEWGQRTSLVTFVLEPHRMRVVIAKFLAGTLTAIVLLLFTIVFTASLTWLVGQINGIDPMWDVSRSMMLGFGLTQLTGFLIGFAFGMLIPNTPAAIVVFFLYRYVFPPLLGFAALLWDWFEPIEPWINLSAALAPLSTGTITNEETWHLISSFGFWVCLPLALGSVLLVRREIK